MRRWIFLAIVAAFLLMIPLSASAQLGGEELPEGVSGDDVYRVSSQMYCDVCAGVPISSCPSVTCRAWRQEIANLLGQGMSDQDIMEFFAVRYGDDVTGVPVQGSERNLALLVPIVATLIVGTLIVWRLWHLREKGDNRARQAAQAAGLLQEYDRPVPDNVDHLYLERFLRMVEDNGG